MSYSGSIAFYAIFSAIMILIFHAVMTQPRKVSECFRFGDGVEFGRIFPTDLGFFNSSRSFLVISPQHSPSIVYPRLYAICRPTLGKGGKEKVRERRAVEVEGRDMT